MGMVGGGPGAFIGPVHRIAAELDGAFTLVAGAFSSDASRSVQAAEMYGIAPDRSYDSFEAMMRAEAARDDGIDMVVIATPNHLHLPIARAALTAGIAVMSDKPATATLPEAQELAQVVRRAGCPYALTFTYTGYPLIREARALVRAGVCGNLRKILVDYPQGWLAQPIELDGTNKQASWRCDPMRSGPGGCVADIGVHAFNLAEFVGGRQVTRLLSDLGTLVPGRRVDDDAAVLLRFEDGVRGVLTASQVAIGELNGLSLRVYGDQGSLTWQQENPNILWIHRADGRSEILRSGEARLGLDARAATRLPGGHPEGYFEALGNLYRDFAVLLRSNQASPLLPGIEEGLRGMAFIDAAVAHNGNGWIDLNV